MIFLIFCPNKCMGLAYDMWDTKSKYSFLCNWIWRGRIHMKSSGNWNCAGVDMPCYVWFEIGREEIRIRFSICTSAVNANRWDYFTFLLIIIIQYKSILSPYWWKQSPADRIDMWKNDRWGLRCNYTLIYSSYKSITRTKISRCNLVCRIGLYY